MRPMRRLVAILALALVAAGPVAAQDEAELSAQATLSPSGPVAEGQGIRLIVRASGSGARDVSPPSLAGLRNLRVLQGPSISSGTQMEIINMKTRVSFQATFVWMLVPERAGPASVPALTVEAGGRTATTEPIRIEVLPAGAVRPGAPKGPDEAPDPDVFLRAEVSRSEAWVGQPIVLEVSLWAARQVSGAETVELAELRGFWNEDIPTDPRTEAYRRSVGGREYVVYPIARKILVPTEAGEARIGSYVMQVQVPRRTRDLFGEFFGRGLAETFVRKSPELRVKVRPLPDAGRPEDFGGAVGSFRFRATLDRSEAAVNDAVALRATVEGEGWLQGVPAPRLDTGDALKLFLPKGTGGANATGGRLLSTRTWEWVLVPLVPGETAVPPLRFSFFDPEAGAYRTLTADPGVLVVRKGEGVPDAPGARTDVVAERRDLRFLKAREGPLERGDSRLHRTTAFRVAAVLPAILAPLGVLLLRRRARLLGDRRRVRRGRAHRRARKRLREARGRVGEGSGVFHESVARALVEYVADRHDRSASGLTYDVAESLLASDGIDTALRNRFRAALERCDMARFVPGSDDPRSREELLGEAAAVLDALEDAR